MHALILSPALQRHSVLLYALKRSNIECSTVRPEQVTPHWILQTDLILFPQALEKSQWRKIKEFLDEVPLKVPFVLLGRAHKEIGNDPIFKDWLKRSIFIDDIVPFNEIPSMIKESIQENYKNNAQEKQIKIDDFKLDRIRRELVLVQKNECVILTKKEFYLLELLMLNAGRVISRETIVDYVWDRRSFVSQNTIEVYISRLRNKIDKKVKKQMILTIPCLGYQFEKKETLQSIPM